MTQDDEATRAAPAPNPPQSPVTEPAIEHKTENAPSSARPTSSSGTARGFLAGLAGGVVVTLLAGAGLAAAWPSLHDLLLADETRRLDVLERAIDDLNPRLVAVEREQAKNAGNADTAAAVQALTQRVNAMDAQIHAPAADPRVGALTDQAQHLAGEVDRLNGETQALRRAIPPEGTILRLAERAESAERQAHDIASQHASAQALLLVVGQLREAVDRGDPYPGELQAARRVAAPDEAAALDALAPNAAGGIPRKDALVHQFPELANDILRASVLPPDGNFWQRALARLSTLISIRRVDGQGNGTAAVVARAESQVRAGDLAKAARELSNLQDAPRQVAEPWIQAATARTTADRALSDLSATAAAQTAKSGG